MAYMRKLSVVICTFNRADLICKTIDSLIDQSLDKELFEILIVDNNSSDSTREIAESYVSKDNRVRYIFEGKQGKSVAANRGIKESSGEYIGFVDDDVIVCSTWCSDIIRIFESDPEIAAIGGKIIPYYDSKKPSWFDDKFEIRSWGNAEKYLLNDESFSGFSGANMAFRKDVLILLSGFDESIGPSGNKFMMGEDTEIFMRLKGIKAVLYYCPAMLVQHYVPSKTMTIKYRMRRSFLSGIGAVIIKSSQKGILYTLAWCFLGYFKTFFMVFINLIVQRYSLKYSLVNYLFGLAARTGSVYGLIRSIFGRASK